MPAGVSARPGCLAQLKALVRRFPRPERRWGSAWLEDGLMQAYVRCSSRPVRGQRMTTLDIAAIVVFLPGRGTGTEFLRRAHETHPYRATYIENVLNARFAARLLRDGWRYADADEPLMRWPSLFRMKGDSIP